MRCHVLTFPFPCSTREVCRLSHQTAAVPLSLYVITLTFFDYEKSIILKNRSTSDNQSRKSLMPSCPLNNRRSILML